MLFSFKADKVGPTLYKEGTVHLQDNVFSLYNYTFLLIEGWLQVLYP